MKKILILSGIIALAFTFSSCKKEDANKDVDDCIKKLNYFNETFIDFNQDGVISRDTLETEKKSEYDKLKKIASEYYEMMNKINSQIEDEKERLEKGKKIKGYEKEYKKALIEKQSEIDKSTASFEENLGKI